MHALSLYFSHWVVVVQSAHFFYDTQVIFPHFGGDPKRVSTRKNVLCSSVHLPTVAAHKVPDKRGSILKLRGRDASPAVVGEDVICRNVLTLTEKLSEHSHDFLSVHI